MANASDERPFTTDDSLVENATTTHGLLLPPLPPALPLASIVVGLVTGVTGTVANAVVFVVLVFVARRHFGSSVNTLIANQSAMDLSACVFLVIGFGFSRSVPAVALGPPRACGRESFAASPSTT